MRHSKNIVDILTWREQGQSCKEIAERLGVPEWQIHNVMKQTGNAGRWRARPKYPKTRRKPRTQLKRLEDVLSRYGSLYIEPGAWSGYIATLDDRWTGSECLTTDEAIYSAIAVAEEGA
jgi:transposase